MMRSCSTACFCCCFFFTVPGVRMLDCEPRNMLLCRGLNDIVAVDSGETFMRGQELGGVAGGRVGDRSRRGFRRRRRRRRRRVNCWRVDKQKQGPMQQRLLAKTGEGSKRNVGYPCSISHSRIGLRVTDRRRALRKVVPPKLTSGSNATS